jgi:hypothetical protein
MFGLLHGLVHFHQRDAMRAQACRVNVDLILLHESADARDFAHAIDRVQLVAEDTSPEWSATRRESNPSASTVYQ